MEKTKNEILSKIWTIINDPSTKTVYKQWLKQVEKYICEKQN